MQLDVAAGHERHREESTAGADHAGDHPDAGPDRGQPILPGELARGPRADGLRSMRHAPHQMKRAERRRP